MSKKIIEFLYIVLGTLLISIPVVLFYKANDFVIGGTPGAALLLYNITGFSIGSMVIAINIPLLILGIKYFGKIFAVKTVVTIILMSFFIDFISYLNLEAPTKNMLLASIFGGVLVGFGVGFIIKANSSAGGSTIIAKLVAINSYIKPSQVILVIDIIIVIASIYVFKDIEKTLYSIISIYLTAKAMDVILTGTLSTKVINITSYEVEKLSLAISKNLGVQGTILKGSSLLQDKDKNIILVALDVKRLNELKEIIKENDPKAFMIVMEASEMLGRGH